MAPISASATLFRSASSSSLASSSDERFIFDTPNPTAKRTRKRFNGSQLAMFEQLFHHTSHPSRDQREALALELDLEPKVVTIWFQNRRQNERKASLNSAAALPAPAEASSSSPAVRRTTPRRLPHRASTFNNNNNNNNNNPHSSSPYPHPRTPRSLSRCPTLETMALRSELRSAPPPPRTPSKRSDPAKSPWDNMPSSPLVPPSPPEQEFVQFGMRKHKHARSLEWACAAARLVGKRTGAHGGDAKDNDDDETDEEDPHEAITPMGSLIGDGGSDVFWDVRRVAAERTTNTGKPKDSESELMDAALLLCGLGRKVA